jgi:hypothetical protein
MHWECQSNWIPFLNKIAPSDDLNVWKVGANIRLDFSLVGFKQLKNKRRKMSIIIRENKFKTLEVFLLNHEKQIYVDPMEDLDQEEMMAVLTDMINSDPI